jgi:hypothetical protein
VKRVHLCRTGSGWRALIRVSKSKRVLAVMASAGAVLAGCSSPPSTLQSTGAPATAAVGAEARLVSELVSPLNYFANGPGFTAEVQRSYEEEIAACMRARGWTYIARDDSLGRSEPATVLELGRHRKSVGYSDSATGRNRAYVESLSPSERRRYSNDLSGGVNEAAPVERNPSGCQPMAFNAIGADMPIRDREFANAWSSSVRAVLTSQEYLAGVEAWRSCMTNAGHAIEAPDRAPAVAQQESEKAGDPESRIRVKLAIASADFDCQVTALLPVKQRLEQAQIATLVAKFPQYAARASQLK